jgi:hypothetical protein
MQTKIIIIAISSFLFLSKNFSYAQDKESPPTACLKEIPKQKEFPYDCVDLSGQDMDSMPDLSHLKIKELNLSHNQISYADSEFLPLQLEKLNLSYNNLTELFLGDGRYVKFLDVSDNPKLSSKVFFHPDKIKKIKSDNIADKEPLIFFLYAIWTK